MSGDGNDDAVVATLLVEYSSLREESLAAIEHRMTATNFTFAALAVIIAALVSSAIDPVLGGLLLLVAVPQLAKAGLLIWLGEYARSQRAGRQVARIETRVNDLLGEEVLTWEGALTTKNDHLSYPYLAVVGLLLGTGYAASAIGLWTLGVELSEEIDTWPLVVGAAAVVVTVWEVWFYAYFRRQWRSARAAPASSQSASRLTRRA